MIINSAAGNFKLTTSLDLDTKGSLILENGSLTAVRLPFSRINEPLVSRSREVVSLKFPAAEFIITSPLIGRRPKSSVTLFSPINSILPSRFHFVVLLSLRSP